MKINIFNLNTIDKRTKKTSAMLKTIVKLFAVLNASAQKEIII